ncbi:MAG: hypothetical protein GVY19_08190 [Bacteroidetes bacterium]|jgi:Rho-binding antiterminator|nr:hypothetical protein [Bacteroidota bacterium]
MNTKYHPVDCEFHDQLEALATQKNTIKINFWVKQGQYAQLNGKIKDVYATEKKEEYILLHTGHTIRLDHIITIDGKPGPGMDEYEDFANACLDCRIQE